MSVFYPKLTVIPRALRNVLIKSYSNSAQKSSQAVTKSVTKKPAKGKRDAGGACSGGGGGSKSAGGSGTRGGDGCSTKSSLYPKHTFDKCDMIDIPKGHSRPYRMISYCLITMIIALAYKVFDHQEEHETHYVPYDYMYLRTKKFFWGDHRKSFFHGPNNFLPDEEEYKKLPDPEAEDLKRRKELRDLHAKEELERRKRRREQEALKSV